MPYLCLAIEGLAERALLAGSRISNLPVINTQSGFESLPLRHTVWSAEKSARIALTIRKWAQFANCRLQSGPEKVSCSMLAPIFVAIFSAGHLGSPVSTIP